MMRYIATVGGADKIRYCTIRAATLRDADPEMSQPKSTIMKRNMQHLVLVLARLQVHTFFSSGKSSTEAISIPNGMAGYECKKGGGRGGEPLLHVSFNRPRLAISSTLQVASDIVNGASG